MYVKFLKAVAGQDFEIGKVYEIEDEAEAEALIDAGTAEKAEKPQDEIGDVGEAVRTGIGEMVKSAVADGFSALKAATPPRVDVGIERTALDPRGTWKHAGEFLRDVYAAGKSPLAIPKRLREWDDACKTAGHMEEGDDSQGGFLVPSEFLSELQMNKILETGLAGRCRRIPMATNSISIPYVNETTHATSVYGGVIVYRTGEAQRKTASKPTFGLCTLTLHKTTAFTYVSEELLEDSAISVAPIIGTMFPDSLRFTLEDDIINGTGAGMGLGIIPAPATITVARAGAGAITRADVLNMYRRMYPRSLGNAVWLANIDTMGEFQTMDAGTGAGTALTWIPPNGDADAPYGRLLGRPIYFTELCQTLGTAGDLIFADLSQMFLGQKPGGMRGIESSIHLRFDYNEVAFRSELRTDHQPWWPAPLTPRYSGETLSPFVILGDVPPTTTTT